MCAPDPKLTEAALAILNNTNLRALVITAITPDGKVKTVMVSHCFTDEAMTAVGKGAQDGVRKGLEQVAITKRMQREN